MRAVVQRVESASVTKDGRVNGNIGKGYMVLIDAGGEILLVSQITLYGDARHGKRPSVIRAARPEKAIPLYEKAIAKLGEKVHVETGIFGAEMKVQLINDGPVTILLDSERTF